MDIVLELVDTFVFDWMYSQILPASSTSAFVQGAKHVASSTFSSMREGATVAPPYSYKPASTIIHFEPSAWAYRSAWPRDLLYRQAISLFLITWCAYVGSCLAKC